MGKKFGVEQYEMRTFHKDRNVLETLVRDGVRGWILNVSHVDMDIGYKFCHF